MPFFAQLIGSTHRMAVPCRPLRIGAATHPYRRSGTAAGPSGGGADAGGGRNAPRAGAVCGEHGSGTRVPVRTDRQTEGRTDGGTDGRSVAAREAQVHAGRGVGRVGPAGGDDLAAGVEVRAVVAVDVVVAEEGVLPAAEGVVADGDRDRHVHA